MKNIRLSLICFVFASMMVPVVSWASDISNSTSTENSPNRVTYCHLKDNLEYREVAGKEGLRYIVCRNPEIARQQRKERDELMQTTEKDLNELKTKMASCKDTSLKGIVKLVEGVLSRPKDRRLYGYKLNEKKRNFEILRKDEQIRLRMN